MANPEYNLNQLNTPDIIKNLPEYHGDLQNLGSFIRTVNPVVDIILQAPEVIRPFWLQAIRNKIKGKAHERIRLYGEPQNWTEIRNILLRHFSDHRDQRTLYMKLQTMKQKFLTIHEFYDKCLEIVTALNEIATTEANDALRNIIVERNISEGLHTFLNGIREPLKTILLSRNPQTLYEAYNIAIIIQPDVKYDKPQNFKNYNTNHYNNQFNNPFRHNIVHQPNFNNNFNRQPNFNNNGFNNNNHHNFNNHNNFSRNSGNFRKLDKPVPMEVDPSSRNIRNPNRNSFRNFNQNQNNHFRNATNGHNGIIVEELFVNENFRDKASEN